MDNNKSLFLPAIEPARVEAHTGSTYPEQFKHTVEGRSKQRLGDALGLKNFGVNLTTLAPGSASALRHWHTKQDEFIYVVRGQLVLVTNAGEQTLGLGMAAGFAAGVADGHQLINRTTSEATYIEVGDRTSDDEGNYPDDDLAAKPTRDGRKFFRKDGTLY